MRHIFFTFNQKKYNLTMMKIGIFTSGGDSPGMNAGIWAAVKTAKSLGIECVGIKRGYEGLIENDVIPLRLEDVNGIISQGGTILKTARSKAFMTAEGRAKAIETLKKHKIDALLAIGGDGTFRGAVALMQEYDIPIVGIPGTIDNDLFGTDYTIGFDTALNTAMTCCDKIRDTAESHGRLFFVEVMGRDSGSLALHTAIACGADALLIPEDTTDMDRLFLKLKAHENKARKESFIVIVSEGETQGGALSIAARVKEIFPGYDTRVSILGHVQRGGNPSAFDRILASRLAAEAIGKLNAKTKGMMVGLQQNQIYFTPFGLCVKQNHPPDESMIQLI
jgi:6-phosphofructokinase 1